MEAFLCQRVLSSVGIYQSKCLDKFHRLPSLTVEIYKTILLKCFSENRLLKSTKYYRSFSSTYDCFTSNVLLTVVWKLNTLIKSLFPILITFACLLLLLEIVSSFLT